MTSITSDVGEAAFAVFCNERKLDANATLSLYEFIAFIDLGTTAVFHSIRFYESDCLPCSDYTQAIITSLTGQHGPSLIKAMIVKRYASHRWPILKIKKYYYLILSFIVCLYLDILGKF